MDDTLASTSTSSTTLAAAPTETTPLLKRRPSSVLFNAQRAVDVDDDEEAIGEEGKKGREVEVYAPGKSTFAQTVCGRQVCYW
jgi:hypothetical protein